MFATPRQQLFRRLTKSMRIIEIGPLVAPIAAKKDGWDVCIVDRAPAEDLRKTYHFLGSAVQNIEEVDCVWKEGPFEGCFTAEDLGSYDVIICSHVLEHMANPVGFLRAAAKLLKPQGELLLLLPDKRCSFDFYRPLSLTGDLYQAFVLNTSRYELRNVFNHVAYAAKHKGLISWRTQAVQNLEFISNLAAAKSHLEQHFAGHDPDADYHLWCFVPASFHLIIEELAHLGILRMHVTQVTNSKDGEFLVSMKTSDREAAIAESSVIPSSLSNERRLLLLRKVLHQSAQQYRMACLGGALGFWNRGIFPGSLVAAAELSLQAVWFLIATPYHLIIRNLNRRRADC